MKNMNMKWISFVMVLVIAFTLLAPMAFAETAEDTIGEIGDTITSAAEDDATEYDAPKMIFEPLNFVKNLSYMGLGMLGIFIVIGVIIIATALLNKLFKDKKED